MWSPAKFIISNNAKVPVLMNLFSMTLKMGCHSDPHMVKKEDQFRSIIKIVQHSHGRNLLQLVAAATHQSEWKIYY